jgi:hypothetical protein
VQPGRLCPLHYRYAPSDLASAPELAADTLYVIGGLYGNLPALEALRDLAGRETGPVTFVFNGDFNWFNVDDAAFASINTEVLRHVALRGNVETEIAGDDEEAGCGCAYPDWVADPEVERSNRISDRLRTTARRLPALRASLRTLPMYVTARVGAMRVGIVHGDVRSLAGWDFSQERLGDPAQIAELAHEFEQARCRVIASSHTCLPVTIDCNTADGRCVLINNGAAGMPNFHNTRYGLITRIALTPATHAAPLYTTRLDCVHIEALPLPYDHHRWLREFLANWPPGTPAHRSYFKRIDEGPAYDLRHAIRWRVSSDTVAATDRRLEEGVRK